MKKQLLVSLFMFVSFTIFAQNDSDSDRDKSTNDYFKIEVYQDNKIIKKETDGTMKLQKKPFKFKVILFKKSGVDVSASWGKYYYDYPINSNIYTCEDDQFFKDCRFVAVKTGNQDKFNVEKDLAVGDGDYQWHWFYEDTMDWHRFDDSVQVEKGIIYAEMTVENIYDCDLRDTREAEENDYDYPIEKIDKNIYMVFAVNHYESGMETPEELQREKLILEFE